MRCHKCGAEVNEDYLLFECASISVDPDTAVDVYRDETNFLVSDTSDISDGLEAGTIRLTFTELQALYQWALRKVEDG